MGLVIQPPAGMLVPAAATATAPPGAAATALPAGDAFAALFASLAGTAGEDASGPELDQSVIPAGDARDDAADAAQNPLAALLASTVPLVLAPQVESFTEVVTATTPAIAPIASPATEEAPAVPSAAGAAGEAPSGAQAPAPPAEAPPAANLAAGLSAPAPAPGTPPSEAPPSEAPPSEAPPSRAAILPATAAATAGQAIPAGAPSGTPQADSPVPPAANPTGGPPPTGSATPASTTSTSVVRTVGNADTTQHDDPGQEPKEGPEGPEPRASVQGLKHAAPNSAVGELRTQPQQAAPTEAVANGDMPALQQPTVPHQVEQVAHAVIERVESGGGEARIHLDPAGLGEVTIHVHTDGDTVRIDVRAERHEAAQLLRDHTHDLSSLLGERGLNLSDVNVGLGRGNAGQAWPQDSRPQSRPAAGEFASIFGREEPAAIETHNRLRATYNPDGAHIYRI